MLFKYINKIVARFGYRFVEESYITDTYDVAFQRGLSIKNDNAVWREGYQSGWEDAEMFGTPFPDGKDRS